MRPGRRLWIVAGAGSLAFHAAGLALLLALLPQAERHERRETTVTVEAVPETREEAGRPTATVAEPVEAHRAARAAPAAATPQAVVPTDRIAGRTATPLEAAEDPAAAPLAPEAARERLDPADDEGTPARLVPAEEARPPAERPAALAEAEPESGVATKHFQPEFAARVAPLRTGPSETETALSAAAADTTLSPRAAEREAASTSAAILEPSAQREQVPELRERSEIAPAAPHPARRRAPEAAAAVVASSERPAPVAPSVAASERQAFEPLQAIPAAVATRGEPTPETATTRFAAPDAVPDGIAVPRAAPASVVAARRAEATGSGAAIVVPGIARRSEIAGLVPPAAAAAVAEIDPAAETVAARRKPTGADVVVERAAPQPADRSGAGEEAPRLAEATPLAPTSSARPVLPARQGAVIEAGNRPDPARIAPSGSGGGLVVSARSPDTTAGGATGSDGSAPRFSAAERVAPQALSGSERAGPVAPAGRAGPAAVATLEPRRPERQTIVPSEAPLGSGDRAAEASANAARLLLSRLVSDYSGGDCFAALTNGDPSPAGTRLSALSDDPERIDDFATVLLEKSPDAFRKLLIDVGEVGSAQCSALAFLAERPGYPDYRLRLRLDDRRIADGGRLAGSVEGLGATDALDLLLVDDEGTVLPLSAFVERDGAAARFSVPVSLSGAPAKSAQLVIAMALPESLVHPDEGEPGEPAGRFFPSLADALRSKGFRGEFAVDHFFVKDR
ncbi:hypothetical protein [Jiella sonneratiae]|uniref:Serine/threonine protein kinase n=1 Tax=Jiella sonneratiae TaxID=2816856 RepID=A0ABS3J499_9HYPH|nr:hypothetical protein [Jiella sonneratiae]MBO0904487.1 hypothetical protein [Jiella sonneratiae]